MSENVPSAPKIPMAKPEIQTVYLWRNDQIKIVWMNPDADQKSDAHASSAKTLYELLFPGEGLPRGWGQ